MNNNQKIAVNSLVQYVRLVLSAIIALYSVRIILRALGASDFGIYNVVAGVVAMLGFINSSLSQTTIRYISVNLGIGNDHNIRETFNSCLWLHILLAIALFILLEIVGFFFFEAILNIDPERVFAAKIIYQCMLITLVVTVSFAPFSALLIAHEHFLFISVITLLDSLAKLGIAFLLLKYGQDRLIMYGLLMMLVTIFNYICYISFVYIKYRKEAYVGKCELKKVRSLTSFTGWTLLDVLSNVMSRHGFSVVLNFFCGTLVNAAYAVARQIESQMFTISSAIIETMKPQIMKSYGAGDKNRMVTLSFSAGKFGFYMEGLVAIPLIVMMPIILKLWIVDVPEHTVFFANMLVISCMSDDLSRGLVYACQAVGNIKSLSIGVSICRFLIIPISIMFFIAGISIEWSFILLILSSVMCTITRIIVMHKIISFKTIDVVKMVLLNILLPFIVTLVLSSCLYHHLSDGYGSLVLTIVFSILVFCLLVYSIGLSIYERSMINNFLSKLISIIVK